MTDDGKRFAKTIILDLIVPPTTRFYKKFYKNCSIRELN
jgi:hypothetical protein